MTRGLLLVEDHNRMTLKKATVVVDEDHLKIIKAAAACDGRPESEYFREAVIQPGVDILGRRLLAQFELGDAAVGDGDPVAELPLCEPGADSELAQLHSVQRGKRHGRVKVLRRRHRWLPFSFRCPEDHYPW